MKEIKYLAKFVSEESFANDLICGNLFMRPVWYFRELEKKNRIAGQGDMREGAVFVEEKENQHYYMECFENSDVPIFCTYIIYDEDILDGRIYIPQKVITDFHCQDGYVVLIDYLPFQDALKTLGRRFSYCEGAVHYRFPTRAESIKMFCDETVDNLFYKSPYFRYQKEHRIVVGEYVNGTRTVALTSEGKKEHIKVSRYGFPDKSFDSTKWMPYKIYKLDDDMKQYARKITISSLERNEDQYVLIL